MSTTALSHARPATEVVPFRPETHLQGAVEALLRLRRTEGLYPPRNEVEGTMTALAYWLLAQDVLGRWTALADGRVAGHIAVSAPQPRLAGALGQEPLTPNGFCEVSRFFVDPDAQRNGIGTALFDTAIGFTRGRGLQPTLAVPDTSLAARRLFVRHGMTETGRFRRIHGESLVLVDLGPATRRREPAVTALAA